MPATPKNLFFKAPLFEMNPLERFLVKLSVYSVYGVLCALTLALLISDVKSLNALGWLLLLFLGDRALHLGGGEKSFAHTLSDEVNAAEYFSATALAVLEYTYRRAKFLRQNFYLLVLQKLIAREEIEAVMLRLNVPIKEFSQKIDEYLKSTGGAWQISSEDFSTRLSAFTLSAFHAAEDAEDLYVEPKDLFAALGAVGDEQIRRLFDLFQISAEDLNEAVIFNIASRRFMGLKRMPATLTGIARGRYNMRHRVMNRAWTARPTPTLDEYGEDLTDMARLEKVGFLLGHDEEYARLVDVLARPSNANCILIGAAGVGKETIVAHLAFEIEHDRVPPALFDKRLVSLQLGSLVSGAEQGELRRRAQKIVDEIMRAGNVILYIPDLHNLVRTSGPQNLSVADIFVPAIKSELFSVIGTTYPREFKQYIEPISDFSGTFENIRVSEINETEAAKILVYQSILLERQYKIVVSFAAIKKAVSIARRYFPQIPLPGGAADILKEALADASANGEKVLTPENVISIAERKINIPMHEAGAEEAHKLLDLESVIHERLIDQNEAVSAVSRALREYRSGLARIGGPIATFLFVGPTGVGKTELAKILAKVQFGSQDAMVRFDMSEYQDKQSFFRFIGSPDGSVSGALTDAILQKPYSLVLLDEFEKAYPDILNLFLQVFDDGRLTDNLGRKVDFQNTMIIATSNARSDFIKSSIEEGKSVPDIAAELKKRLSDFFRPELLNRFSGIIVFKTLSRDDIVKVAALQLQDLTATVMEAQGINVSFDDEVVQEVARLGYDPVFGARPLRGVIEEKLRAVLAEKILRGEIARGSALKVGISEGAFTFFTE